MERTHDAPTPLSQETRTQSIFRPEQPAPTGDGIKDLRPLPRALLDPAAYLDAPTNRRRTHEPKINYKDRGVDRPRPFRDDRT